MRNILFVSAFLACLSFYACRKAPETLFQLRSPDETGITFANTIQETDSFNILTYEYIYNGGGVAVADFNNDGLQDLFFSGNEVGNKLYLNKGGLHFEDVSATANVNVAGRWNSGVALVDINNDGLMDIYVCATMKADSANRRNMLFINNGLDQKGVPTFTDRAASYGLESFSHSIHAAFFDYDLDGDLDLYVLTNVKLNNLPTNYRPKIIDGSSPNNDQLFRNNGDGTFTNVSKETGIILEGFGLGLAITDVNLDGWPDIYVSNDYLSNDVLYINDHGKFKNRIGEFIGHQSQFSMGNDAADINNDGRPEIITLDMLPEINRRKKSTIGGKTYQNYINNEEFGYEYQHVRNMLHLNNGVQSGIKFSEIGELSGVYQTEWSWSPLFADFDNDGNKDLLVTNGFPKDITDKDFAIFRAEMGKIASISFQIDSIPIVKIPNYAFRNRGDLTFEDVSKPWGLGTPTFSNGAAFVDMDNDGDLDYVVNNINQIASVYENRLYNDKNEKEIRPNYLRIKLKGQGNNKQGIGTKVSLRYGGKAQYNELTIYRGFLSSVEQLLHFGIGQTTNIDSVLVQWPDGEIDMLTNVKTNQILTVEKGTHLLDKKSGKSIVPAPSDGKFILQNRGSRMKIVFKHREEDKVDFNIQRTLPHKFSQSGPGICVGDIDGDGMEDFLVGGSSGFSTSVFMQKPDGTFAMDDQHLKTNNKKEEDEGLLLFDADNDGDLDLYAVSGSLETGLSPDQYQDRLYINDGKGHFTFNIDALPETIASGSCVRAADFDADGDLDLFVGGRVVPGSYPLPPQSYLLRNDHGKFTNATGDVCAELNAVGMVTDALWSDFDQDGKVDLVVVGEFMAITFYKNEGSKLARLGVASGIDDTKGWWNSIAPGDFDGDGDIDYVVGNLGLNNNYQVSRLYPLKVFAKDFDGNGSIDPIMACYQRESMEADTKKLYPMHFWDEINSQSPKFRKKFRTYKEYGSATLEKLLTAEERKGALVLEANEMASGVVENLGNGKFKFTELPTLVQVGPVNGMVTDDFNGDGNLDVLLVGNDYGNEVFAGRYDALTGLVLLGDGKCSFSPVESAKSGFYVGGDAKALCKLSRAQGDVFLATQNRDSLKAFARLGKDFRKELQPKALDYRADLIFSDGRKKAVEFYYGSGYLSQSTRKIRIPEGVKEAILYDYKGASRKVNINPAVALNLTNKLK